MLLTLSTTRSPATDLGYLLHKNPTRVQSFDLSFGKAHVFYPQAAEDRCTAALLLDVDPVWLVRGRKGPAGEAGTFDQYVNDRPYVASSLMSVAIAQVFGTALSGRCKERPELAENAIPLEVRISVLPCRGGEGFLQRLFGPLGYELQAVRHPLDPTWPDWGDSAYYTVTLRATRTVRDVLSHLYVLIPVLDNDKHYWVGQDEVDKLLRHGEAWLADHPERETIAQRYLKHQPSLARQAITRLIQEETPDADEVAETTSCDEEAVERPLSLNEQRTAAVLAVLRQCAARRVVDLGCGEGRLLRTLLADRQFSEIMGLDVSCRSLENASNRLQLDRLPPMQAARIRLLHGSLMYRDQRISGFDAATVIEVIEHLDPPRLTAFERVLFEFARPKTVIMTTPNREYNVKWPTLPAGSMRHRDHRFEWTRAEFADWARTIAERFGYVVRFLPVGSEESVVGPPTQMGVFETNKPDHRIRKPAGAFADEKKYGSSEREVLEDQVSLDSHELLDYARMRAEVAVFIRELIQVHTNFGLIGFLTGSVGPLVTARLLLEPTIAGKIRYVNGLSQPQFGVAKTEAERDYHENLDDLYQHFGVRHFVLVDEIKSGGQMNANLISTKLWLDRREIQDATFSVLGVRGGAPQPEDKTAETIVRRYQSIPIHSTKTFRAKRLLEMDEEGLRFKAVKRGDALGEYDFVRLVATKGLIVRCAAGGPVGGGGVPSLDAGFNGLMADILEKRRPECVWPETILTGGCDECRKLLAAARKVFAPE